jgi:DNA mismatch repair protein MutS
MLTELEAEDRTSPARRLVDDLPLFAAAPRAVPAKQASPAAGAVIAALSALDPDDMSPREALEALYALKLKAAKTDE